MQRQPKAEDHKDEMHHPETHDRLFLAPANKLKMMVQWRHFENFSPKSVSRNYLNDDRQRLYVENKA